MNRESLGNLDLDLLPYGVTDSEGRPIQVCFSMATMTDLADMVTGGWPGAPHGFWLCWLELVRRGVRVERLHRTADPRETLGLLRIGRVERGTLRDSLLETAPRHRSGGATGSGGRCYGIGRVLVARLAAAACQLPGAAGRVLVRATPKSAGFYERLGFRQVETGFYLLEMEGTLRLLNDSLIPYQPLPGPTP